ncbi:hypothetical protein PENSTE_c013G08334 [Penicillium steckii]|uniref:Zinc/iron permease n=1 Tax=Penicillium steckii TaxID=303698 RepID=A0A1V6T3P9_9EURO|nr:hypothetical protein PENSTE_c013G08334 [Penicillium steckii]
MAANDLRGWIMSGVSGVACVLGSAVICVDLVLRRVTHHKSFQIANSNNFLSASLCLSAGVMLFTSLYSMLPTSKEYLTRAGFSPSASAYILIGLFLGGVVVIRILSSFIHRFIPSHVVDCAHSHGGAEIDPERGETQTGGGDHHDQHHNHHSHKHKTNGNTERTPLLRPPNRSHSFKSTPAILQRTAVGSHSVKRESLQAMLTRRITSLVGSPKPRCDENGPCYGFSQTCGHECTKVFPPEIGPVSVGADEITYPAPAPPQRSVSVQNTSGTESASDAFVTTSDTGYYDAIASQHALHHTAGSCSSSPQQKPRSEHTIHVDIDTRSDHDHVDVHDDPNSDVAKMAGDSTHHHHVPQNAFLSIGLQTVVAIALHKLPEGFITYATNHASPTLGLTVFLALFIHNIVEGFAMALPLYLALNSRLKAMFWSSLLGGISQPLGAGIAALWIWGSGRSSHDAHGPSWGVYGGMFAVTAGVMTSVALSLFSEGLGLTHHRSMGIGFAVAGMGLMGVSFALTA